MKYKLLFLLNILLSFILKSQNINISFFDSKGRLTFEETAYYYRQSTDTVDFFRSFYSNSKHKHFEGYIINASDSMDYSNKYKGLCKWYYPNGKLKTECQYNDAGILSGKKKEFDTNGKLIKELIYENGKIKDKRYMEFDEKGNVIHVLREDFSDNYLNWPIETNEITSSRIRIGGFELINKAKSDFGAIYKNKIDSINYSVETLINSNYLTTEAQSGIIFGYQDWNNYGYFYISKYRFCIGFVKDGIKTNHVNDFFSYELKGNDWNKIAIQSFNDSLCFFINDKAQAIISNSNVHANNIGLYINNGSILFDEFYIKQYDKKAQNFHERNRMFYNLNQGLMPVNQVNSGVIIGKSGFILTSIKNLHQVNDFLLELYINDTVKTYKADVFYNSDIYNFTILKIKTDVNLQDFKLEYNFNYIKSATVGVKTIVTEYEKSLIDSKWKLMKINGDGKIISEHQHTYEGIYNNHSCIGAPAFDQAGNILGIISDVNKENIIKVVPIQQVLNSLFSHPEVHDVKHKPDFNVSDFYNKINENIVVIKTF